MATKTSSHVRLLAEQDQQYESTTCKRNIALNVREPAERREKINE